MENCECKNIIEKILGTTTNDINHGSGWWPSQTEDPGCTWFPANDHDGGLYQLLLHPNDKTEKDVDYYGNDVNLPSGFS